MPEGPSFDCTWQIGLTIIMIIEFKSFYEGSGRLLRSLLLDNKFNILHIFGLKMMRLVSLF